MATIYYDDSADLSLIQGKQVAIFGYGSQGHAHALNLKDSGVSVRVALADGSSSRAKAEADGLTVASGSEAAAWADVVMILAPDTVQRDIYDESIAVNLQPGNMLMFAHGFNIRFKTITPPSDVDVTLIAPKAPGHRVREVFLEGGGTPALIAVEQDATGGAKRVTECNGAAIHVHLFMRDVKVLHHQQDDRCKGFVQFVKVDVTGFHAGLFEDLLGHIGRAGQHDARLGTDGRHGADACARLEAELLAHFLRTEQDR